MIVIIFPCNVALIFNHYYFLAPPFTRKESGMLLRNDNGEIHEALVKMSKDIADREISSLATSPVWNCSGRQFSLENES